MLGARGAEPVVARSDVVASPRPKSWTWIVKTEKEEKDGSRRESEHAREGGREKEAKGKSDDGGKATLWEKLAGSSLCTLQRGWSGVALEMEERKKKERESERKREVEEGGGREERASGSRGAFSWFFKGKEGTGKAALVTEDSYREYNIAHVLGGSEISILSEDIASRAILQFLLSSVSLSFFFNLFFQIVFYY